MGDALEFSDSGQHKNQGDHEDVSIKLPPEFLCGIAISVFQNSGDPNTNWAWFEDQKKISGNFRFRFSLGSPDDTDGLDASSDGFLETLLENVGPSVIEHGYKIGISSDFWNNYERDIQLAKDLGSNSFRLSLEWSRIMPRRGYVDGAAIHRYHQMFDVIDRLNMETNVTLYWFVLPKWFMDMGGFEKEENIAEFIEWTKIAFTHFGKRSKLWSTINEPAVSAMCGYIVGNHPPGKKAHFKTGGTVLLNILKAHTAAYNTIKSMPGGRTTAVGIVHNVFWLEPKGDGLNYAHVKAVLKLANRIWGNETVMDYLKYGRYESWNPFGRNIKYQDPKGKPGCDFLGVNHYARAVVDWKLTPSMKGESGHITDMGYSVYPPSLYRAISYASTLGVPVYIMENGIPCPKDDPQREKWIHGVLQQIEYAIADGFDVRGFMYWTLIDNWEWNFAWILQFGLYTFEPHNGDPPDKRELKPGGKALRDWYVNKGPKLTKLLSKMPVPVKPDEERWRLEEFREREYLQSVEHIAKKDVPQFISQDEPAERMPNGDRYKD